MSMISSLIDELRQMADGQVTYRDARAVMLKAADTIWELRDDLQRANAAAQDAEHDESMAWDRVRKAEAESASLKGAAQGLGELCDKYKSENAKLHELIVRCCDCENAREHYDGMDVWWCEHLQRYVGSDGFCCWGIRRDYEEGK